MNNPSNNEEVDYLKNDLKETIEAQLSILLKLAIVSSKLYLEIYKLHNKDNSLIMGRD